MNNLRNSSLREQVASLCHSQWAEGMRSLSAKYPISAWGLSDWTTNRIVNLMDLAYEDLDESSKEDCRDSADKYLDLMEEWKEKSSIEKTPTWEVEVAVTNSFGTPEVREVEADCYDIFEDGRIVFYKDEVGRRSYPVAIFASLQWIGARRIK